MPAIFKDGKWYIGDNSGHMIKDNGTDLYPREALNFTDFNVQDDSVNDETDIKPHRLTQEELSEIITKKPSPKESYPILFDETGAEHFVGWYKYADGTKKPIYEKMIDCGTLPNSTEKKIASGMSNIYVISIVGFCKRNSGVFSLPYASATDANYSIAVSYDYTDNTISIITGTNRTDFTDSFVTIQYTKTTDQPQ